MLEIFRAQGTRILGVLLVLLVGLGTITLAPLVAKGLERLPWLIHMHTGGAAPEPPYRETPDPLPFESTPISADDLTALGLPVAARPTLHPVDFDSLFPPGHVITDQANEHMVLSARRAIWVESGVGADVMLVELPTHGWANSLSNIHEQLEVESGDYPAGATQSSRSGQGDQDFELAIVEFVQNRLWVVVQVGLGPDYFAAVKAGEAPELDAVDLAREVSLTVAGNLPELDDLVGWDTIPSDDQRPLNAASLGLAATLTILVRALGGAVLDRGSRELLTGIPRRRPRGSVDVDLSGAARWQRLRSALSTLALALGAGAGLIVLYFVTGALGLVSMFLLAGGLVMAAALLGSFVRRPNHGQKLGVRWRLLEGLATGISAAIVASGIFCVGSAGIGFSMGLAPMMIALSLLMLVVGLALVGLAPYPAQLFRRLAMPAIKRSLESDERVPVLLLRSFQDDDLTVRIRSRMQDSPAERLALLNDSTFEDLLAWRAARVGPLVAIGQPDTRLQPLGAVRDYFSDDEWQTAVLKRINTAVAVIFVVGRSPGAQWELAQLRQRGALGRTLFVFPPVPRAELDMRSFVLSAGLGLVTDEFGNDVGWGRRLLAARIGEQGEVIRYLADSRDDVAYTLAIERGLADVSQVRAILNAPAGARDHPMAIAEAEMLLAVYDPDSQTPRSSDPFRGAVDIFVNVARRYI